MKTFLKLLLKIKNLLNKNIFEDSKDVVLYICGNDALPSPLEPDEEKMLFEEAQKGNDSARDKLIEHNLRLVVYISKKFENTGLDLEDLISIGAIGLIKAVKTFNFDKNIKFATYASRCIGNEILMQLRKTSKIKAEVSLDEPLKCDADGNELLLVDLLSDENANVAKNIEQDADNQILLSTLNKLCPREREIMTLRFGLSGKDELTQKEVADLLGISQSYISRIEKKILGKIKVEFLKASNA